MSENDKEILRDIVDRLKEKAEITIENNKTKKTDFDDGASMAFYEVMDVIRSEIELHGEDAADYGLDFNLEAAYLK